MSEIPHLDGVTHRYIDLPGLRMHVAEAGTGEPVLLLHGFPQHWWEWREVMPRLAERYRVICPDLRGAGWTDTPPGGYDSAGLLADVVHLLDALGLDRVRLIAHDWGAIVGFQLCLSQPERVRAFVSLSIPHPYIRFQWALLKGLPHGWYQAAIVSPWGPRLLSGGDQRLTRYLLRRFSTRRWTPEEIDVFAERLRDPARGLAGRALYRNFIQREAIRMLRGAYRDTRLTTPTRLIIGAEDPSVRAELLGGSDGFADDLTIEVVDGASHFVVDDRPDAVVEQAVRLFART